MNDPNDNGKNPENLDPRSAAFQRIADHMRQNSGISYTDEEVAQRMTGIVESWPEVMNLALIFSLFCEAPSGSARERGLFRALVERFAPFVDTARKIVARSRGVCSDPENLPREAHGAPAPDDPCGETYDPLTCILAKGHDGPHDSGDYCWGEASELPEAPLSALWADGLGDRFVALLTEMDHAGIAAVVKVYLDPDRYATMFLNEDRLDVLAEIALVKPALTEGWVPVPADMVLAANETLGKTAMPPIRKPVTEGEA